MVKTGQNPLMVKTEDDMVKLFHLVTSSPPYIPRPILNVLARQRIKNYALDAWIATHRPELASRLVFITGDIANEETAATLRRTGAALRGETISRPRKFISVVEKTMGKAAS